MNAFVFLLLHGCLAAAGEGASLPDSTPAATSQGDAAAALTLLAEVRRIAARVETLRGVRFGAPVVAVRGSDESMLQARAARAREMLPEKLRGPRGRAWADLGLGAEDLPARWVDRLSSDLSVAAVDPETGQLRVAREALTKLVVVSSATSESDPNQKEPRTPDAPPEAPGADIAELTGVDRDELLVAHVLVHLLQRGRPAGGADSTTDRLLAQAACAEGEANLVAVRYIFGAMGIGEGVVRYNLDPEELLGGVLAGEPLDRLPPFPRALVRFVVQEGYARVVEEYRKGGWKAVERFSSSRASSRDLLHPERAAAVSKPEPGPAPAASLVLADVDALGEQGVIALVSVLTGKDDLALVAGEGWSGDSLARWEFPDATHGEGVTVWESIWASPAEAEEFAYALGRSLEDGLNATRPDPAASVWSGQGRVYRVVRREARVSVRIATAEIDQRIEKLAPPKPEKIKKT